MKLLNSVRETILKHGMFGEDDTIVVGVSGGPDSLSLLHALKGLQEELGFAMHVGHLEHGIRGDESQADAAFVKGLAQEWQLPASVEHGHVPAYAATHKLAIEEAARRVRYSFLGRVAHELGAQHVAVGHNADDHVETILMHWMRGAGLGGLRGILPVQVLGAEAWWSGPKIKLVRPLLEVRRREIEAYCQLHRLQPRFDRSNLDLTHHRNRIRHELIPHLEGFNPRIRDVLRRSAQTLADDYDYLRHQDQQAWEDLAQGGEDAVTFPLRPWLELHPSLQRQLLRKAIHRLRESLRDIDWVHVEQARLGIKEGRSGAKFTLPRGLYLFKGYETFSIGEQPPRPDLPLLVGQELSLKAPGSTPLPTGKWQFRAEVIPRAEMVEDAFRNTDRWQAYLDLDRSGSSLTIRRRRPGDRFQPLGMGGREKSLSDFMINAKIPRQIRDHLPLIVSPRHILWVAGWRVDERTKLTEHTSQVLRLRFTRADYA